MNQKQLLRRKKKVDFQQITKSAPCLKRERFLFKVDENYVLRVTMRRNRDANYLLLFKVLPVRSALSTHTPLC